MQNLESSDNNKMFENEPAKLDWMYGNPNHVQDEEYLLGRAVDTSKNHVEHECIPPSIRDLRTANDEDQVDIAKKLQEDPLMEIHRRQIEARKKMLQNPIKLKQMQELLKKKGKKHSSDSEDSSKDSSDDDDLNKKLMEKFLKLQKLKKKKRKKSKRRHSSENDHSDRKKRKKSKKKHSESSNDDRKSRKRSKDSEDDRPRRKRSKDSDDEPPRRKRSKDSEDDPPKRKKSKKSSDSDSSNDEKKHKHKRRSESKSKRKHKKSYSQEREMQYEKYRNRSNSRERAKHYGLVNAEGEKISASKSTHKHVEKKPIKRVEEKKAWVKPSREKLTEEEKEKRRQEMLENVQWKEKTRPKLKNNADDMDKDLHQNYKDDPEFLKKYLLKSTDIGSVESRIKSNINNIQRRTTDMDSNFARR
ncbi:pre-mRNA-splicing factor CWC25 homolog [Chrysoperla carnea]|uniref:pre-mRNA-splicing factor CWC25 homolog n=1 Tax=Chrysoperla carnea TaxID=189513 RepID=UPI001D0818A4|nr:pre-mRNA-splicing factor CWC25 homolog [Chrysoperla carnea]